MVNISNNFFGKELFAMLQEYCRVNKFQIIKAGTKEFCTLPTPPQIIPLLEIPNHSIILTFIRKAYKGFDSDLRIHCDHYIQGEKSALASVLYINEPEGVTPNGTAFWKHEKYGLQAPEDLSDTEFDRLITEDANDESKWERLDYISAVPNRMVTYSSNLFHSKYPKEIEEGQRTVLVIFYKKD